MTGDDIRDDPNFQDFAQQCHDELVPKLDHSAYVMSLVPGSKPDIKFAVELGLAIMMDKPIMAVVGIGQEVPKHLERAVDEVIVGDITTETGREALAEEIKAAQARLFAKFGIV